MIAIDIVYLKTDCASSADMGNTWARTLTVIDEGINYPAGVAVEIAGGENTDPVAKMILTLMKQLRNKRVAIRRDGEPAMVALAQKVQINGKGHGMEIQLQQVPANSHQSSGAVENANDLIQKHVRTMRLDVEQGGECQDHPGLGIWPWLAGRFALCLHGTRWGRTDTQPTEMPSAPTSWVRSRSSPRS